MNYVPNHTPHNTPPNMNYGPNNPYPLTLVQFVQIPLDYFHEITQTIKENKENMNKLEQKFEHKFEKLEQKVEKLEQKVDILNAELSENRTKLVEVSIELANMKPVFKCLKDQLILGQFGLCLEQYIISSIFNGKSISQPRTLRAAEQLIATWKSSTTGLSKDQSQCVTRWNNYWSNNSLPTSQTIDALRSLKESRHGYAHPVMDNITDSKVKKVLLRTNLALQQTLYLNMVDELTSFKKKDTTPGTFLFCGHLSQ